MVTSSTSFGGSQTRVGSGDVTEETFPPLITKQTLAVNKVNQMFAGNQKLTNILYKNVARRRSGRHFCRKEEVTASRCFVLSFVCQYTCPTSFGKIDRCIVQSQPCSEPKPNLIGGAWCLINRNVGEITPIHLFPKSMKIMKENICM